MASKSSVAGGPIFVLTIHRSGSTALSRILNCHPNVTIWGEHGGFINQLAEIDDIMTRVGPLGVEISKRNLDEYITATEKSVSRFNPWVSPVNRRAFQTWAKTYIRKTFSDSLPPGHHWGFKEVRYHSPRTVRFLAELFPHSRFILLTRNVTDLCLSNIFTSWSFNRLAEAGIGNDEAAVRAVVDDCVYALRAIEHNFAIAASRYPERTLALSYDDIGRDMDGLIHRVFTFLEIPVAGETYAKINRALSVRSGATRSTEKSGLLARDFVSTLIPDAILKADADLLANEGPDLGRLKRLKDQGRYSFLVGDHGLHKTTLSSMF